MGSTLFLEWIPFEHARHSRASGSTNGLRAMDSTHAINGLKGLKGKLAASQFPSLCQLIRNLVIWQGERTKFFPKIYYRR
ncbi:MAG: hypothetical protein DDT19_02994 [Syntrophomonadaceae bacterium]|nr:hypothetical protein [Bacillota bacterium]